jgi:hypothetical protein
MIDNTVPIAQPGDPSWMHRMDARSRRLPAVHDGLAIHLAYAIASIPATAAG